MISIIAAILFFYIPLNKSYAEPFTFNISLSPEFGLINGTIFEEVWNASMSYSSTTVTYNKTTMLSRLDWQLNNAPYIGIGSEILINKKYLIDFSYSGGLTRESGIMEDYDWKKTDEPDHLTNYSRHALIINNYTQINANIGYLFNFKSSIPFCVIPKIGVNYFSFDFSGYGGYKQYESEGWQANYNSFKDQIVISYKQSYVAPRFSFYTNINKSGLIEFEYGLGVSYIKSFDAIDSHIIKHEYFDDKLQNIWILDGELKLLYKINKFNKIGIKGSFSTMQDSYGFTYTSTTSDKIFSDKPISGNLGGSNNCLFKYSVFYVLSF